jgi:sarcosine oxidase
MAGSSAVVVGAGVFGSATARELSRRGWDVRLVEQYMPGNTRSGSGGDTRLLRFGHGDQEWYTLLVRRSRELWLELERETGLKLFDEVGLCWFDAEGGNDAGGAEFSARSEATLRRLGIPVERLTPEEARRLYPSVGGDDLVSVLFEPTAGVLQARTATRALAASLDVEIARATPSAPPEADVVIWACGSWMPKLFPGLVDQRISRREVFFFGVDGTWTGTPGFADYNAPFYGHGEVGGLGVKIAPDGPGVEVDPDGLERLPSPELEAQARAYAAKRFPALADAPIVGSRVCQYDITVDTHFLVAPHPEQAGWWLIGGGSGHGFKHGPALGEYVADCVEGLRAPEPFHALGPRTGEHAGLRTGGAA